ncbi:MAG: UDP-N-acetylmuramate--L-alanine ligase, partial [Bacteroidales bacterium]|nr:UDP-N-acetylmuramate--L-alanine ligase [Bacteroidales bacterium]
FAVYTPAIPKDFGEFVYLMQKKVPLLKRAQVLGMISGGHKTLAVAGTHGKTTTSSILAHLFVAAQADITAFLGGICQNFSSNFVAGTSDSIMVVEADEFDRSFLHLNPYGAVITSMDADHLDVYGSHQNMIESFSQFASLIDEDGYIVLKKGLELNKLPLAHVVTYSSDESLSADVNACNIRIENNLQCFDIKGIFNIEGIKCGLPGLHNIENATAAITLALLNGLPEQYVKPAIESFKGVKRRFEYKFRSEEVTLIDDYAHHPEELKACILAAKQLFPSKEIIGIFQPHLYSRSRDFAQGFADSLSLLDHAYLLDIYPARELPIPGITSSMIADLMREPKAQLITKEGALNIVGLIEDGVVIFMGAGDIDQLLAPAVNVLEQKRKK